MSNSVIFRNVTKKYKMYKKTSDKLLDILLPKGYGDDFFALQNISFTASPGDVIGIIGVNGAGKSTLSNLITGIIPPTSGSIETVGETSLIAIASGMNNELTGRENIELKCLLMGYSKQQIKELTPSIIEFADIGHFIDQPLKKYSSGMKSRLGFAISVTTNPDILVIDEALSVGDQTFADKCLDKMNEFKAAGKTIFFISHSIGQVKKFCNKALWLEAGEVKEYGSIKDVMPNYEKFLKEFKEMSKEEQKNFKQMVLEKRSKEKKELEINKQENNVYKHSLEETLQKDLTKIKTNPNQSYASRTSKQKRKKKGLLLKVLWSLCILFILAASGYVLKNKNFLVSGIKEKTILKVKDDTKNSDIINSDKKVGNSKDDNDNRKRMDIRYVNVNAARIHQDPSLESDGISMTSFGDAFEIFDTKNNPTDDIDWLKIHYDSGKEGWISSNIVTSVNDHLEDKKIISTINGLLSQNQNVSDIVKMIGKEKTEIDSQNVPEENIQYLYNKENTCNGISINLNNVNIESLIGEIGTPQLQSKNSAILYHGLEYDYIFYYSNDISANKLYINKVKESVVK
ncbi:teichoic acids export ABC transporter ATP-binding subunit TagH [Heyndrickxia camelliae]|uniref:Teichoic acids export ABC transporter ATP-binding subunit TagH n=1 Tax=Heyndrickxia camelliae TaxID=1707093 RepID=A0A2N3LDQ0_9BACI|nr:teichoic acids export ABC transporter ATP-binding subunit TagH [Heyndrickxia camelliae]PKR82654.1 teichoic acids export ABC transporter ATP-binding subunit TagH [Heyndrickxia camelliae]